MEVPVTHVESHTWTVLIFIRATKSNITPAQLVGTVSVIIYIYVYAYQKLGIAIFVSQTTPSYTKHQPNFLVVFIINI